MSIFSLIFATSRKNQCSKFCVFKFCKVTLALLLIEIDALQTYLFMVRIWIIISDYWNWKLRNLNITEPKFAPKKQQHFSNNLNQYESLATSWWVDQVHAILQRLVDSPKQRTFCGTRPHLKIFDKWSKLAKKSFPICEIPVFISGASLQRN